MFSTSNANATAVSALLDMARPGILNRVFIPAGPADITNGMPIVRCLSGNDDALSPDDVSVAVMPRWASWLVCTIADNIGEEDYLYFSRGLAELLSYTVADDVAWESVSVEFVAKMTEAAVMLISPLAAGNAELSELSRSLREVVASVRRTKLNALERLAGYLNIPAHELSNESVTDDLVFNRKNNLVSDIRSIDDVAKLPFRMLVWGAGLLSGMDLNARRMALNYDWCAFLLTNALPGGGRGYAGLDWVELGRWLVTTVVDEVTREPEAD